MITLKKWPTDSIQPLNDLYLDVDQSFCLVQLPIPFLTNESIHYLNAIHNEVVDEKPFLCFGIYEDDTLIGKVEVTRYPNNESELDIVLRKQYTQKGYATEALQQLRHYLQERHWCTRIHAFVNENNLPVRRLLEKSYFQPTRKFKADVSTFHDGSYVMKEIIGIEYISTLEETL